MASFWSLFSCSGKQTTQVDKDISFKIQSKQNPANKTVAQNIFNETTEFYYSDFADLKHNADYDRFLVGRLELPTGQVVCTDPMYRALALPQSWEVDKGEYSVYLYIGLKGAFAGRVAYAELVIKDEIPKYWEMSLISEQILADAFEKKMNGMYPVENGLSCFADFETFKIYEQEIKDFYKLNPQGNYYKNVLEKHFKQNSKPVSSRGEDWLNYKPAKANGNIIMFGSGYGDGLYPRYVGYDKDGYAVKLITDFIQLEEIFSQ